MTYLINFIWFYFMAKFYNQYSCMKMIKIRGGILNRSKKLKSFLVVCLKFLVDKSYHTLLLMGGCRWWNSQGICKLVLLNIFDRHNRLLITWLLEPALILQFLPSIFLALAFFFFFSFLLIVSATLFTSAIALVLSHTYFILVYIHHKSSLGYLLFHSRMFLQLLNSRTSISRISLDFSM